MPWNSPWPRGEVVTGGRALAGRLWRRNAAGDEGWVPERVLAAFDP